MEAEKNQTLKDVQEALEAVEDARFADSVTAEEKDELEKASVKLRKLERTITRDLSNELVSTLKTDAQELKEMADEIKKKAEKLAKIAGVVEKAAKAVKALADVASSAASGGLI